MLDHLGVQVADVDASLDSYLRPFASIGPRELMRYPVGNSFVVGLGGPDDHPDIWSSAGPGVGTREVDLALRAPDRAAVHEVAVAAGAEVLHAPREWPEYHPGYYGVFLRDPDGHDLEAVHHGG
jgi:catechol 2,3-dioxygenase-like lactoylglutathione lyase family enzyme